MKILLLLSAFTVTTFLSCKKKDVPANNLKVYITKKTFAGFGSYTYNYDGQNKLTSEVFTSSDESANPSFTNAITGYNAQGNLLSSTYDYVSPTRSDLKISYTYNANGSLDTWVISDFATNAILYSYKFEYTPTTVKRISLSTAGVQTGASVNTFSADGKRIIKFQNLNASNVVTFTQDYSNFDDKKNDSELYPLGLSLTPVNENNPATITATSNTGVVTVFNYTFEYNEDGYRTKRISSAGSVNTFEYTKR
jgi:hypothetical protein